MTQSLQDALKAASLSIEPDFSQSKIRKGSEYLFLSRAIVEGSPMEFAHFGSFKTGHSGDWSSRVDGNPMSADQEKAAKDFVKKQKLAKELEKLEEWDESAKRCATFFETECGSRGFTPYMERKKIKDLYGAKIHVNHQDSSLVIVPLYDLDRRLWNYQRIYPVKLSQGDKFMEEGARIEGCAFRFGNEPTANSTVYVCEGYATGASIFEALGEVQTVYCALNAGNLKPVVAGIRKKWPESRVILCADDDRWPGEDGKVYHTGERKGREALESAGGTIELRLPKFPERLETSRPTDFNDIHCLMDIEELRDQLLHPDKYKRAGELTPILSKGKPSERQLSDALLHELGNKALVQDSDLFLWRSTHWEHAQTRELNGVKNMLEELSAGKLGHRDVEAAFKTFLRRAPTPPKSVSLFSPNPFCANFTNGTLHLHRVGQSYKLKFHKHNQLDYLTHVLPFHFPVEPNETGEIDLISLKLLLAGERNAAFDEMLKRIWAGDPDQEEKIRLYAQNLGAILIGAFPQIFMYLGKPKTGKSTLLLIAARLIDASNRCSVDPSEFEGFNLESMVGRRVNIDTDIQTRKFLSDAMIKKIIDRVPFRIRRKGKADIYGAIPAIHCFAANELPKSLDVSGGALDRRVILVKTEKFQPEGQYDKDFHDWVYEQGPQGVINFAIGGLIDLIENRGHYSVPDSAAGEMTAWKEKSDAFSLFVSAIKEGVVFDKNDKLFLEENAEIERKNLWQSFIQWHEDEFNLAPRLGRTSFYTRVNQMGIGVKPTTGVRVFQGIGCRVLPGALC